MAAPAGANADDPIRVFNRSDRVWAFGFVRMAPLLLLIVGVLTIVAFEKDLRRLPHGVTVTFIFVCLVGPFVVDRLPQLNPVDYLRLAGEIRVVRLVGRRQTYPPARVVR